MAEIQDAKLSMPEEMPRDRALRVARLLFDHLQRLLDRDPTAATGGGRVVPHLVVPPLELDWDSMDDDRIAREGAVWVYRWLRASE